LYNDLAEGFAKAGHKVTVLTTTPHYNYDELSLDNQPLVKKCLGLYYLSKYKGIEVYHIPAKKYKSILLRLCNFLYFHIISILLSFKFRETDFILSPSPPLSIGIISIFIAKLYHAKSIYNVQEVYPDFIINQGLLKNKSSIFILKKAEKFIYKNSSFVTTIDESFASIIRNRLTNPNKIKVIPNFIDTDLYSPLPKINDWSKGFENINQFIVMYAGNIGFAQDWDPLIYTAKQLVQYPIQFYIIGEGSSKIQLENEVLNQQLENITILGYQKRELMPYINAFADIHFITMNPNMENDGFPSKVYAIMSSGKPVIVSTGDNTPLGKFVNRAGSGIVINASNKFAFAEAILKYYNDSNLLKNHSRISREFVVNQFSKDHVVESYLNLME
jgi:glycosyltransferase involved in cell wall biosynthesis